jgi:hypothetical protein
MLVRVQVDWGDIEGAAAPAVPRQKGGDLGCTSTKRTI